MVKWFHFTILILSLIPLSSALLTSAAGFSFQAGLDGLRCLVSLTTVQSGAGGRTGGQGANWSLPRQPRLPPADTLRLVNPSWLNGTLLRADCKLQSE